LLKPQSETEQSIISLSNIFHELRGVEYAHPNFYCQIMPDSYFIEDAFYPYQWGTAKTVSIPGYDNAAWEITTGDTSIYIAIIDQGLERHEDLDSQKIWWGYDFYPLGGLEYYTIPVGNDREVHGMAVAGLILAPHNNPVPNENEPESRGIFKSIAGVAPQSRYFSVRIMDTSGYIVISDERLAEAIGFARDNGADVLNCSWSIYGTPVDAIDRQIDSTFYYGRGGLGAAIIYSAGNRGQWESYIRWPKNKSTVLAVGAIKADDTRFPYSSYGDSLDLVAPSGSGLNYKDPDTEYGIWSLDQEDSAGINPLYYDACISPNDDDYFCWGGGTSLSAPLVSGIAALMLARRPTLISGDIYEILKYSAVTELAFGTITPPDYYYGYGRANALRALLAISRGDANNDGTVDMYDATS
jgi:subtilisin family serine protease